MSSLNRGSRVVHALAAIVEHGEITGLELAEQLGIDVKVAHVTLKRMATRTKAGLKRIHIVRYDVDHFGARRYPRPVYALGDAPDKRKPRRDTKARKREYYHRIKGRATMNSVFNLGLQWRAAA